MARNKGRFLFQTTIIRTVHEPDESPTKPEVPPIHKYAEQDPGAKLSTFWNSTPLWSGITMLLGAIFSHFSLLLVYFIAWALAIAEFIRVDFFKATLWKVLSALAFACATAAVLFLIWKNTPKQPTPPTLDQEANKVYETFIKKMPWLAEKPREALYVPVPLIPHLTVKPEGIIVAQGLGDQDGATIVAAMDIANTGSAPGTVANLEISLKVDGKTYKPTPIVPPNRDQKIELFHDEIRKGTYVLPGHRYWSYAVGEIPIQPNSSTPVWTFEEFRGITREELTQKHSVVTVRCVDVLGKVAIFSQTLKPEDMEPASSGMFGSLN